MTSESNSYKTATLRIEPSRPIRRLASDGLIIGRTLDYGCGQGLDADYYGMESYDLHFAPIMPDGKFDTITCTYVLNVIEDHEVRVRVLQNIQHRLTDTGIAYITVRDDKRALCGITRSGSWQGLIVLALPVRYKHAGYVTYELRHRDSTIHTAYVYHDNRRSPLRQY